MAKFQYLILGSAYRKQQIQQEQKVLKASAPRVNFMFSKQKSKKCPLKKSQKIRNSLKLPKIVRNIRH